ncbi:hypothetical protein AsAng_0055740 [Aureispira anguillae]|uniref:Uncharacterized protein n=1 Tax=Aureispira anguillae TaxID=2864201 RepID=A0A915YKB1_9BACT|nr:hypothetical protein AsAng_0055740 [Aureispira anguillae]
MFIFKYLKMFFFLFSPSKTSVTQSTFILKKLTIFGLYLPK